ncbi:type-2 ice-structuring protein-like [Boleophthalmus pectinirostris]|uniref:type-2 ice-structuring protein-like n=1 Tax=Boleophthalmus pectinirostris TaxID=150288 RepID=UPI000A1C5B3C|nr:type-2 ice-structuring protein-like [Boleophthalmus pectinirostris]
MRNCKVFIQLQGATPDRDKVTLILRVSPMKLLVVLLFVGSAVVHSTERTLPGVWETFNGRSFMFVKSLMSWSEAQVHCSSLGGSLASIHNVYEEEFVSRMTEGRAWIGLTDSRHEGLWLWSSSEPVTYLGWCAGRPDDDRGQHCAVINHQGQRCWDDMWCNDHLPFVCAQK